MMLPAGALAHEPVWGAPGGEKQLPDIANAFAWHQEVTEGSGADIFVIESEGEERLRAEVRIPRISGLDDFQVNMVLLGPGLPPIFSRDLPEGTTLPQDQAFGPVCEGTGSGVVAEPAPGGELFDSAMLAGYQRGPGLDVELPDFGTYYLIVISAGGQPGKYVLETGREESSGAGDLVRFPVDWVKTQLFFGRGEWLIAGVVVLVAVAVGAGLVVKKRRAKRQTSSPA